MTAGGWRPSTAWLEVVAGTHEHAWELSTSGPIYGRTLTQIGTYERWVCDCGAADWRRHSAYDGHRIEADEWRRICVGEMDDDDTDVDNFPGEPNHEAEAARAAARVHAEHVYGLTRTQAEAAIETADRLDELERIVDKIRAAIDITPRAMDRDDFDSYLNDLENILNGDA